MIWPFRKKKQSNTFAADKQSWKIGDMAECIETKWTSPEYTPPALGYTAMVIDIAIGTYRYDSTKRGVGIKLLGHPGYWTSHSFRKIQLQDTGADRKHTESKPTRQKVPA